MPNEAVDTEGVETDDFDLDNFDWDSVLSTDDGLDDDVDPVDDGAAHEDGDVDEDAETDGDQPTGDADDSETYTIKWKGEEKQVSLEELISLAQQGEDYTRKTQQLATERDAAANWKTLEQSLAADFDGTMAALRRQLGLPDTDIASMDPIERELHELKTWRAQQEADSRQRAVFDELASVKQRYNEPELDEDALLAFAVENGIANLDVAYKAMRYENNTAAADAAAEVERQRQARIAAKRNAPKVTSGDKRNARTRASGASDKPSIREALLETLRELG